MSGTGTYFEGLGDKPISPSERRQLKNLLLRSSTSPYDKAAIRKYLRNEREVGRRQGPALGMATQHVPGQARRNAG